LQSLLSAQDLPHTLPHLPFHLTAKPWTSLSYSRQDLISIIESACRVMAQHQDEYGAIVDPILKREHQYTTPYFVFAVGTILASGGEKDLLEAGVKAMEHSTSQISRGSKSISDEHGEFFIGPLSQALALYAPYVSASQLATWTARMKTPLGLILQNFEGRINNWRTYGMKGEWTRAILGLVEKDAAVDFIEKGWHTQTQRIRIVPDKWNLYQDWSSDPQSLAVEAVGRGNLIGLVMEGYDGPAGTEIAETVRRGTETSLLLQAPDGQAPSNGRTDNHVFNDVLYQLAFEVMAEDALNQGNLFLAGRYRRAANLAFKSINRWHRTDEPWAGSFYVTKNHFDPGDRIGYQPASQWGNYNGAVVQHLAEAWHHRKSDIREFPAPAEIGGYAFETDSKFGSFFANAGGMQVVANLRGASVPKYGYSWTPLGVIRISKVGWDARLGPSDGIHDLQMGEEVQVQTSTGEILDRFRSLSGVTFGPEWMEGGQWLRIADVPAHYQAIPEIKFVHPLLVKFTLHYTYVTGRGGPYFSQEFIITPDAVVTRMHALQNVVHGVIVPLLENDGRNLQLTFADKIVTTRYTGGNDEQNFISLNNQVALNRDAPSIQSSYGWLKPVRFETEEPSTDILIYPKTRHDPPAEIVLNSFEWTTDGFKSVLGKVSGTTFLGPTSAGGEGNTMDLTGDGANDAFFDKTCYFIFQLHDGKPTAVETDRQVVLKLNGREYSLEPHEPFYLD
jgi:hypothetical protein